MGQPAVSLDRFRARAVGTDSPSATLFFNTLACTAAYAAFFTARSRRRVYEQGRPGSLHVLPAVWRGALFGALFMVQVVVPAAVALVLASAERDSLSLGTFLRLNPLWILERGAVMVALVGLFGTSLGALGGSLVGLFFDWRCSVDPPHG